MRQRAKPLLGTLVEIRADCADGALFVAATDAAFARVAHIHHVMSFHEASSDLRAIAHCDSGEDVMVAADTWNVLQLALQMEADSEGHFNPTVAPALVRKHLLPHPDGGGEPPKRSTLAQSIVLCEPCIVRELQPVWIDLGGIAKGYAVDAATTALVEQGVTAGVVNAGGDLRVFGTAAQPIYVRHPANPGVQLAVAKLQELSCATSGGYFVPQSAIIGQRANSALQHHSITVIAPGCAVADALTKVLWLAGIYSTIARALLAKHDARAVALDVNGAATYA